MSHKTQQDAAGTNVERLDKFNSILSLSRVTYKVWHDDTISQRNKATKIAEGGGEYNF